jgi:hypothetical protein
MLDNWTRNDSPVISSFPSQLNGLSSSKPPPFLFPYSFLLSFKKGGGGKPAGNLCRRKMKDKIPKG